MNDVTKILLLRLIQNDYSMFFSLLTPHAELVVVKNNIVELCLVIPAYYTEQKVFANLTKSNKNERVMICDNYDCVIIVDTKNNRVWKIPVVDIV